MKTTKMPRRSVYQQKNREPLKGRLVAVYQQKYREPLKGRLVAVNQQKYREPLKGCRLVAVVAIYQQKYRELSKAEACGRLSTEENLSKAGLWPFINRSIENLRLSTEV